MQAMRLYDVASLAELVYETRNDAPAAQVAVIVPLYNYAGIVLETLQSVVGQDLESLSLVVVDDASTDEGGKQALDFLQQHRDRFVTACLLRHHRNQGLSMTRNSGIAWSREPYLFMLDADNRLRPPALSRLLQALECSGAAFAYSQLRWFGDEDSIGIADVWNLERLSIDNYIDAMALIRRDALMMAGGYAELADGHGWEDYDLWCRFAEIGLEGVFLPELLCDYRVHSGSMLHTRTNIHAKALSAEMRLRHPSIFNRQKSMPGDRVHGHPATEGG